MARWWPTLREKTAKGWGTLWVDCFGEIKIVDIDYVKIKVNSSGQECPLHTTHLAPSG
jgi:hypothetical protein